jgi:transketolase
MLTERQCANAVRALAMDAVEKANSGHPGMPMGMADIAEVLWREFLQHSPENPHWPNRDRFILSNGHGSMLLYALLHLTGYDVSIEDLQQFRQLHARTPGHPEFGYAPGVETTTGPLGQGLSNAVGMAIGERMLAAQFNRDSFTLIDHYTYVFLGDGCLMEGISHEACSLAGTLGLGKLIAFWDDNGISIDGEVEGWFTDNTPERFRAYNWHVIADVDGHDASAIRRAIEEAHSVTDKPTLICCKTTIGFGSPNKCGKESCHGSPLGTSEIALARTQLNWPHAPFDIPEQYYEAWDATLEGNEREDEWDNVFSEYAEKYPELADEFMRRISGDLPENFDEVANTYLATLNNKAEIIATRKASQNCLNFFGPLLPELLGGSADLAGSNLTLWSGSQPISAADFSGNYINYGVREFGMSAIMNGLSLYGGFIPYGGTFLVFSDYARNAIRLSAIMKIRVIYVLTHDSIGLGEDGPTHQPIEQIPSLRLVPNLSVWRPCDTVETAAAWQAAIEQIETPTCLCLSRQNLAFQQRTSEQVANIKRGGYVLLGTDKTPDIILIATGSEVALAMTAAKTLTESGVTARVVSMPCTDAFDRQDTAYKESVLPASVTRRVAIEAASADYWYKYVGLNGKIIGMHTFGESAPAGDLFKEFGFTVEHVVSAAKELLK